MDAVTHAIEAVLSPAVNPPADAVGLDGLERAVGHGNLVRAVADGSDREARWQMMMAATEGAMAFVKGLGAVHAMSHSAGRLPGLRLHHGTLNAVLLPVVLRFNQEARTPEKYARIAAAMGLAADADVAAAIEDAQPADRPPLLPRRAGRDARSTFPQLVEHAVADLAGATNPRPVDGGRLSPDVRGGDRLNGCEATGSGERTLGRTRSAYRCEVTGLERARKVCPDLPS